MLITGANVPDSVEIRRVIQARVAHQVANGEEADENLCADGAYACREEQIRFMGYNPHIRTRRDETENLKSVPSYKAHRWVVERFFSWLKHNRKIQVRHEKLMVSYWDLVCFACALITYQIGGIV